MVSSDESRKWHNLVRQAQPSIFNLALFYAVYVMAGGFSQGLAIIPNISVVFWPPAGIFAATLLMTPKRSWSWWVAVGSLGEFTCNALWFHNAIFPALFYFAANALTAIAAAILISKYTESPFRFESPIDITALVLLGAIVAPLVSATLIAATDVWVGKNTFWVTFGLVWLGDGSGLLIAMPLTLLFVRTWIDKTKIEAHQVINALGSGAALVIVSALAFQGILPTIYLITPVLLWIAARHGFRGATSGVAAVTLVSALFTSEKSGIFAGDETLLLSKIVGLQAFLAVSAILALIVASLGNLREVGKLGWEDASVASESLKLIFPKVAKTSSMLVVGLSVIVILGWVFGLESVKSMGTGLATMKVNTALCFVALGLSLAHYSRSRADQNANTWAIYASIFALAVSMATLAEYALSVDSQIDELFFRENSDILYPGRMSVVTAGAFFTSSVALLMPRLVADHFNTQSLLWGLVLAVAASTLFGYATNIEALYEFGDNNTMALHTAAGFTLLSVGGLAMSWPRPRLVDLMVVGAVRDRVSRYFFAVALVLFAAWLRYVLGGLTGLNLPYVMFYPVILLVALLAGWQAGIFATFISAFVSSYYFVAPFGILSINSGELTGIVVFTLTGISVSYLADQWIILYRRTAEERDHLDKVVDERTKALAQSNRQLKMALSAAKMTAWNYLPQTGVVTLSDDAAETLGLSQSDGIRISDDGYALIHPDDRENHRAKVDRALAGQGSYVSQYRHIDDGEIVWMEEYAQVVVDPVTKLPELIGITANISARKKSEEAIKASEELNRSTLQALPAHVAVIDEVGRIVSVNSAWSEFATNNTGDVGTITTVGSNYLEVCRQTFAEDGEAAQALAGIEAVLAGTERHFSMEYACHGPLEKRWFLMIAAPFQSERQKGAVLSHLNITDRKKAELALRESENFSRSVLQASPDCVKVMSGDGKIEFMNVHSQTQMEIDDSDSYIGQHWVSLWPEKIRETVESALAAAKSGNSIQFEAFRPTMKGTPKWWDVAVSPILDVDGHCKHIIAVSRDISQRKRTEEALKTSLDRLETAEYATNALNYDTRGGTVWRGPGLTRVLGWLQDEIPATIEGWLSLVHPEDLPKSKAAHVIPSNDGADRFAHEYRARHKDGHYVWLMDRGRKEYDAEGKLIGIVGASFDITNSKLTEEALRKSERSLAAVFDALPLGVALIDSDGMPLIANDVFKRFVPRAFHSHDEKRQILWEAHHEDGRMLEPEDFPGARALRGERAWPGQEMLYHGGEARGAIWTRVAAVPMHDEKRKIIGATIVIADIDAEKRATDGLRDSEARFNRASKLARFGAYSFDISNMHGKFSPGFWAMMGQEDILDVSFENFLEFVHPVERKRVRDSLYSVLSKIGPYEAEYQLKSNDEAELWVMDRGETTGPLDPNSGLASFKSGMILDITERKKNEQRQMLLINELNHRVKNTLATIQSLASQTLRTSPNLTEAKIRFEARLMSLSKVHDILTREKWESAPFADIVDQAILPYRLMSADRFIVSGPNIKISARMALAFAMTLHELCTNAVKYGALSNEKGKVEINWSISKLKKSNFSLKFRWREIGGPSVTKPSTRGFGTKLIERNLADDLGGTVKINFAKSGVTCYIRTALDNGANDAKVNWLKLLNEGSLDYDQPNISKWY
jgi:PAS domain S-box-containing protein